MTSLPSGLASISTRMDDAPNARGAVDMAKRLRRRAAMAELIALDADQIGNEDPAEVLEAAAAARRELAREDFDCHARLLIGSAYRAQDRR